MAERRTYQGATYERAGPGQPWTLVSAPPASGQVLTDPQQPVDLRRAELGAQRDQIGVQRDQYGAESAPVTDRFSREQALRQQFNQNPEVQSYRAVVPLYISARNAADTRAGDLNIIYAFGKMMDPGSVVREGELVLAQGTSPIAQRLRALLSSELSGTGRMNASTRRNLMAELQSRRLELARSYAAQRNQYTAAAREYGLDPELVVGQHPAQPYADEERRAREAAANPRASGGGDARPGFDPGAPIYRTPGGTEMQAVFDGGESVGMGASGSTAPEPGLNESYFGQGMSGVNEGIANTLGAPIDIMNALYGVGLDGINAAANTDLQPSDSPLLGSNMFRSMLTGAGSIAPPTDDPSHQFVRRVGQSVGGAVIPVAGTAGTMGRAGAGFLTSLGGGVGAATAQQVAPDNPYAEMGAELIGSLGSAGGMFGLARRGARNAAIDAVPSSQQLRTDASNLYAQAESRGVVADPPVTTRIADRVREIAREEELITPTGRVSTDYPRAAGAMQLLDDYAGQTMNPRQIQVVRSTLADAVQATEGNERRIARLMLKEFDEGTTVLAPELSQARRTASRYLQGDDIQRSIDLAEARAPQFSQSGMDNAIRTEFRGLDRGNIRGDNSFPPAVVDAIENVARGTPGSNIARMLGRFAPSTPWAGMPGMMNGIGIGAMTGEPLLGAAATGATWLGGTGARVLANRMTTRNASVAEALARSGGDLQLPAFGDDISRQLAILLAGQTAGGGAYEMRQ